MNWKLSPDEKTWEYRDESGALVDSLIWDSFAVTYRDREGRRLGREFNAARAAVESGHKPAEEQGRLAL